MSGPQVLGLDLSLSSTGVALPDGSTVRVRPRPASLRGPQRLTNLWLGIREAIGPWRPQLVVIEDYAPGSIGLSGKLANAELRGVVVQRLSLALPDASFAPIRPNTLKRWATGNGAAKKPAMMAAAARRGWADTGCDDEADAFLLRALGLQYLTGQGSEEELAICDAIAWPTTL